ncbi:MAG: CNNM domain-containing protein [Phycisphaerae bacterium]
MIASGLVIGAIVAVTLSAFFSGTETGIYCLNRVRLNVRAGQNETGARRLTSLLERPQDLVITTLLGTNVADYLATVCVMALLLHYAVSQSLSEVYATAIVTPLILVFGGVIPKDWFQRESNRLMYALALPLTWCRRVACGTGLVGMLGGLTRYLIRRVDPQRAGAEEELLPRARIRRLLSEAAAGGGLSAFQRDTLERVMEISRVRVVDVMVPRQRAAIVPIDTPRAELLRIARMAHFSRLPVYRDDPRRIVGIVNVYHVLTDDEQKPIGAHVQEATFLHATETVPAALLKMQQARQVMAIVTDRAGNCLGLFTMKDLVEEIVGELEAW